MKKWISLILVTLLCLSLAACSNNDGEVNTDNTQEQSEAKVQEQIYSIGDTIVIDDMFKFTPVLEGYADELENSYGEDMLLPIKGYSSPNNAFKADDEKKMMYFSGTIEYIGNQKDNVSFVYSFYVDYNDGYIFGDSKGNGYKCIITSDPTWKSFTAGRSLNGEGDNKAVFEPLSSNTTRYIRSCIMVPEILESDSESSLYVIYEINGKEYKFSLR